MQPTCFREVPLTKGYVALVDADDYERVLSLGRGRWTADVRPHGAVYARKNVRDETGKIRKLYLHTFVTGWPLVDHVNGNPLDNRRANLRQASKQQNGQNKRRYSSNKSGYTGVSWNKRNRRWIAAIAPAGRQIHLGCFDSREEAARAYDVAAREYFGEFARLNFPD
jgi:hypothetical protein